MSNQREWSLDNFLNELRQLRKSLEQLGPSYMAALDRVTQMPVEFDRRWWSSRVDRLTEKVRVDYQKYQAQTERANLLGKFVTSLTDVVLKAGRMEPVPLPNSLKSGISISPFGNIAPTLLNDPSRQSGVLYIKFEEFEAIAQRLKGEILKGAVVPKNEDEIPRLIFRLAAKSPEKSPGE